MNPLTLLLKTSILVCIAHFSSAIIDKGIELNQLTAYPILGWLMWGILAGIIWGWILKPIVHFLKSPLVILILVCIAYFSSDIIDKGIILNQLTAYPILGWLMWGAIVLIVWLWFLQPIIQFSCMRRTRDVEPIERAKIILKSLKKYRNDGDKSSNTKLYREFYNILNQPAPFPGSKEAKEYLESLNDLLTRYHEESDVGEKARKLILKYSQIAGLGVVFSRNHWMDGIIMMVIQMKLVIGLAKLYGYKPSPVFNLLCFAWVLTNSLISVLLSQDVAEDFGNTFAEYMTEMYMGEDEVGNLLADGIGTRYLSVTISSLLEAIMSGTSVYVTGHIFLKKLENDGSKLNFQDLIKLRRNGRLALGKTVIKKIPKELATKCPEEMWTFIKKPFQSEPSDETEKSS